MKTYAKTWKHSYLFYWEPLNVWITCFCLEIALEPNICVKFIISLFVFFFSIVKGFVRTYLRKSFASSRSFSSPLLRPKLQTYWSQAWKCAFLAPGAIIYTTTPLNFLCGIRLEKLSYWSCSHNGPRPGSVGWAPNLVPRTRFWG